jgi:membrane dipeptidase
MAIKFFVDPDAPTIARWIDHFDHAVGVMGIEHVGLGADFVDQVVSLDLPPEVRGEGKANLGLEGFTAPDEYPNLVDELRERGYEADRLEAIMNGNWLRVLRETLPVGSKAP